METNEITYSEEIQIKPNFSTKIRPNQDFFEFKIKVSDVENIINVVNIKDFLYQEAILNLIKKTKFLQLYIQLTEEQITEEEYDKELDKNADQYFINLKDINSELDLTALILIMQNLPKSFSVDEVSEIFGIKTQSLINKFKA